MIGNANHNDQRARNQLNQQSNLRRTFDHIKEQVDETTSDHDRGANAHRRRLRDRLTALRTASDFWCSALYTFTVALLLVAVLAARYQRGNGKAFWFGFATFGSAVFFLGYGPWRAPAFDPGTSKSPLIEIWLRRE